MNEIHPPKIAEWLVRLFAGRGKIEAMMHNFDEEYFEIYESSGKLDADKWYRR